MKLIAPAIILSSLGAAKFWASALTAPIDGYGVAIPEWEVEVSPGGPTIKLNGTIQEVRSELLKRNPDWDTHYPANITEESSGLNKRAFDISGYFCSGRWPECLIKNIKEGITHLRRVKGYPTNGPGPGNCFRVSCSYKAAIWWCNDARVSKTLHGGYGDIADGAGLLLDRCVRPPVKYVSGQIFSTSDWNVIVRSDTDHC